MKISGKKEPYKIGTRIQQLRRENDIKQIQLAKQIKVDRTSLSSYENNKRLPDIFILCEIADAFGVSLDYLVGREEKEEQDITD